MKYIKIPKVISICILSQFIYKQLYLENLPNGTDDTTLRDVFKEFGELVLCTILHRGRVAIIKFTTVDTAQKALDKMNGHVLNGMVRLNFNQDK